MNTPQNPTSSTNEQTKPVQPSVTFPEKPKRSWLGRLMGLIVIIAAVSAGYFGYIWYNAKYSTTTADEVTNVAAEANTTDPVAAQLKSLSNSTDTSTIKAEIADTQTSDIATELDNIDAELTGF